MWQIIIIFSRERKSIISFHFSRTKLHCVDTQFVYSESTIKVPTKKQKRDKKSVSANHIYPHNIWRNISRFKPHTRICPQSSSHKITANILTVNRRTIGKQKDPKLPKKLLKRTTEPVYRSKKTEFMSDQPFQWKVYGNIHELHHQPIQGYSIDPTSIVDPPSRPCLPSYYSPCRHVCVKMNHKILWYLKWKLKCLQVSNFCTFGTSWSSLSHSLNHQKHWVFCTLSLLQRWGEVSSWEAEHSCYCRLQAPLLIWRSDPP